MVYVDILQNGGLPATARRLVRALRRARAYPWLRIGQFGSLRPLSTAYGFDRGTPIDRFYIESFLSQNSADIRGHVLEVGDDAYSRRFGGDRISAQDVLHISRENRAATIIGDLADPRTLPANCFDCVILTQTLQYVFDLRAALSNIRRSLRNGGTALITLPAISPLAEDEWKDSHYWLFTVPSAQRMLAAEFDRGKTEVEAFGNLYAATAFLHGAAVEEVSKNKLRPTDPSYPVMIAARVLA